MALLSEIVSHFGARLLYSLKDGTLMNSAHELPEAHREVEQLWDLDHGAASHRIFLPVENTTPLFQKGMRHACWE